MKRYLPNNINKVVSIIIAMIVLGALQGCMFYYKVQTVKPVTSKEIRQYDSIGKYLIIHHEDSAWYLNNHGYMGMLSGELSVLPENHYKFQETNPGKVNRYRNTLGNDESCVLQEVHIYLWDSLVPKLHTGESIRVPYTAIARAEIYKKAKGRTTASWVVPAVGGPVLAAGVLVGIIAIAESMDSMGGISLSNK
jgi:hypothetical protein